ncbi:MAG: hypothetical protein R2800_15160 [Flavipsychrobacter sp.]
MKVLITYPVGLLLKAYMLCALVLVKIQKENQDKNAVKPTRIKKSGLVKKAEWQTA